MNYEEVLGRAWDITWHHKSIWVLGTLVALGSSGPQGLLDEPDWGESIWSYTVSPWVLLILIPISVTLAVLSTIARGALIDSVRRIEGTGQVELRDSWRVGSHRFWTLFGVGILTMLPILGLVLAGVALLALFANADGGMILLSSSAPVGALIPLCCLAVIVAAMAGLIQALSNCAAILEGLGWVDAFKRGWQVFTQNPGEVIWTAFLCSS
jgi:hypothetical protein